MKPKLNSEEKARRQGWRTARYEANILEQAAKKLRGETPLPMPTRKGRPTMALLAAASVLAGIGAPRI